MMPNAFASPACWPRWIAGPGSAAPSRTCIPVLPADDRRVVLTAVLADATNLGLTRMAEACSVASYPQLAWTAGWHLREDTYRQALAILVNAQQRQPLAASFGAADVSSSDGQHFPTAGRGRGRRSRQRPLRARAHPRCSTRTSRLATRPTTRLPSRPPARPPTSSTACSTTRPT